GVSRPLGRLSAGMDCLHAAAKATEAAASKATKAATAAPGRVAPTPTASSNVKTAPSWRGIVTFTHPRTGGAHDSHHRTAGIAGRARRRGRLAARGARAAIGQTADHRGCLPSLLPSQKRWG